MRHTFVVVVLLLHPKRLRMILSSACARSGRRTSSSMVSPVGVVVVVESPQTPEDVPEKRLRTR